MNADDRKISDELLNAFLDEQLDTEERGQILQAIQEDKALAQRFCELRQVKALTQHAYGEDMAPPSKGPDTSTRGWTTLRTLAASLVLIMAAAFGWLAHDQFAPPERYAAAAPSPKQVLLAKQTSQVQGIILHLDTAAPSKGKAALDSAEDILEAFQHNGDGLRLEVIANAEGLNLLRADTSPYAQRVSQMMEKYPNLTFLACSRAIHRLQGKGIPVQLLPQVKVAPSALEQIVKRLQEGWAYIKV